MTQPCTRIRLVSRCRPAKPLGTYFWRGTQWLAGRTDAMMIRPGVGANAPEYLRNTPAPAGDAEAKLQSFGDAAFVRSRLHDAGFQQVRALWFLNGGYTVVFDEALAGVSHL